MRKGQTGLIIPRAVALAACSVAASIARAAVTVNGLLDADYGTPVATQTVNTAFGDNSPATGSTNGNTSNGSELDAVYAVVQAGTGKLNLFFAGNVETNFNHLNIFIDDGRTGG